MHIHYDIPVDVDNTVDLFAAMFPKKLELKNNYDLLMMTHNMSLFQLWIHPTY